MSDRAKTWEGGRIHYDTHERPCYVIQRQIRGKRYVCSTRAHTLRAAYEHLRRFEADPEAYSTEVQAGRLELDTDLAQAYLTWSQQIGNSRDWRRQQRNFLAWWQEKLRGLDLRRVSLARDLLPVLKSQTSQHHRISVIKGIYTWLRTVTHQIKTSEDPVFGQLPVPQSQAEQLRHVKVLAPVDILEMIRRLKPPWQYALTVQAGTGWHTTEVVRFAKWGAIEALPPGEHAADEAGVLVNPLHKRGEPLKVRVSLPVITAAQGLLTHGAISREWYDRAVRAASHIEPKIEGFTPGKLRHSLATWAINAGADIGKVSQFLGHRSPRTTKRFYATHASAAKVTTVI
jgi:integrase